MWQVGRRGMGGFGVGGGGQRGLFCEAGWKVFMVKGVCRGNPPLLFLLVVVALYKG